MANIDWDLFVALLTMLAAIIAAVSLVAGYVYFKKQINSQLFLEYTKRYADVMAMFEGQNRAFRLSIAGEPPEPSDGLTLAVLSYLNLCSEEFYLWERKYLSPEIWERELKRTLRSPLIQREWRSLKVEFEAYPEFLEYVESSIAEDVGNQ